jgi:hypothetical protein
MSNYEVHMGLPTLSMLPMVNTNFTVIEKIEIEIPRSGNYHELSSGVFDKDSGDFDLFSKGVLYLPSITKVLLAVNKYPNLKQNQIFTPMSIEFFDDVVKIRGSVLEIINIERVSNE